MAEKIYTGREGKMLVGGADIVKVVNFQVSANLETLETTTLGDNLRSYTPGVVGYSGSATLLYYKDGSGNINVTDFFNKLYQQTNAGVTSSDTVELTLRWDDGTGSTNVKDITMTAYITSASIGASTGDIVKAEIAFQGTGALSVASIS